MRHSGRLFHIAVLYFFLLLFIFGSLYHQHLIRNLGFGLFFFMAWVFCFLLVPWLFRDNDFTAFYNQQDVKNKRSHYFLFLISFFILQLILVLIALQILSFNLMLINLLGISVALLYCPILVLKKIVPADSPNDFGFALFKLIVSICASWYFLYLGCIIFVINFSPHTEGLLTQVNILLIILTSICLTNIPSERIISLKLSFIVGFFVISSLLTYLTRFIA